MLQTTNLVAWYRFEGNATDNSKNTNNGTINEAAEATGQIGQAYTYDGVDDYISVADDASLDFGDATDFTVAFWMNGNASDQFDQVISKYDTAGGAFGFQLTFDATGHLHYFLRDGTTSNGGSFTDDAVDDGVWRHFVFAFDRSGNCIMYIDGVSHKTDDISDIGDINNNKTLTFGIYSDTLTTLPFSGEIDETEVYSSAINAGDVKRLMLGMHPLTSG